MIHAAIYNISTEKKVLEQYQPALLLSNDDYRYFCELQHPDDRNRMLAARVLIKNLLEYLLPGQFSAQTLIKNALGKPIILGLKGISISHSGEYVTVAVSTNQEVGIDIQKIRNITITEIKTILNEKEKYLFSQIQKENRINWFYNLWSKKETIIKADGIGVNTDPKEVMLNTKQDKANFRNREWFFHPCPKIPSCTLQLCSNIPKQKITWYNWNKRRVTV